MSTSHPRPPLTLTRDEMRALGHRAVDMIVDHWDGLAHASCGRTDSRAALEALLREPAPEAPQDMERVFAQLSNDVFAHAYSADHPRFFAFVPGPSNFIAALADTLAAGMNASPTTWLEAAGPSQLELVTIDWLKEMLGYPGEAAGLFVSGGSAANLSGLAVARHAKLGGSDARAVAYASDHAHGSIGKALRTLGFREDQLRLLAADETFRMQPDLLERAIEADREAGRRPFCVTANAGTTNTGAVDPLPDIAAICRRHDLWLHVDGAYGAAAVLCEKGRRALPGLELADSLVVDPHKWLFQPFEMGAILVRDPSIMAAAFASEQEYLQDALSLDGEVNLCDLGLQLTRGFRALKLWLTIKAFGMADLRAAVAIGMENAERAEALARQCGFEIVTPATLGIVTFRWKPAHLDEEAVDQVNRAIVQRMVDDGFAFVTSTRLRGRTVLRLCPINPRTTTADLEGTVTRLARFGAEVVDSMSAAR